MYLTRRIRRVPQKTFQNVNSDEGDRRRNCELVAKCEKQNVLCSVKDYTLDTLNQQ